MRTNNQGSKSFGDGILDDVAGEALSPALLCEWPCILSESFCKSSGLCSITVKPLFSKKKEPVVKSPRKFTLLSHCPLFSTNSIWALTDNATKNVETIVKKSLVILFKTINYIFYNVQKLYDTVNLIYPL